MKCPFGLAKHTDFLEYSNALQVLEFKKINGPCAYMSDVIIASILNCDR